MARHMRKRKKSFRRRLLAWLGISHTSKKYYLIYFLALLVSIILFPLIMKILASFKENYGKGYGYVPRDLERSEKLTREEKPIPFQPRGAWQYEKEPGENDKKEKGQLDPYH